MKYLKHKDIDKQKWDKCISSAQNGLIYAYSWYLDLVAENWDAIVNEDYTQVFPLVFNKKMGIKYLYTPPFVQQLGLFSQTKLVDNEVVKYIDIINLFFKYGDINLNIENIINVNNKYNLTQNFTYHLNLCNKIANIKKNYSENIKRNIKKAIKNEISIIQNISPESIISIFKENKGIKLKNINDKHYFLLRKIIYICLSSGYAKVLGALTKKNELCAGAFFLESHNKSILLFSGVNEIGRKVGAMSYLIDEYISNIYGNIQILDFEGSNDPNLARFYKSFGSVLKTYSRISINNYPIFIKPLISMYKYFKLK